uniref:10 kDa heat shock protein, mitochondrial n=1 Tax=Anas platyrhynchos platyrhynchos TaxID=8840 RepID=A0A493T6H3_ANAPP
LYCRRLHYNEQECNCPKKSLIFIKSAGKAFRKFLPLFDRVLVERCAAETVTKGGIMIPEKAQGKVLQATVVAVGSGARGKVNILKHLGVRSSWKNVVGKGWLQRKF